MKNQLTTAATCPVRLSAALMLGATFGLFAPAPASAQAAEPAGVIKMADFSYQVWASNPSTQPGRLRLINAETGTILFEEYSSAVSFGRRFDVHSLPDGRYAFLVKLGKQQYRYTLNLQTTSQRSAELRADTTPASGHVAVKL